MQKLIAGLMIWAVHHSGYEQADDSPALHAVSGQHLINTLCGGIACPALSYYDDKKNIIFYDQSLSLDEIEAQSVIVHEIIHFLQFRNHAVPEGKLSCQQRTMLETEAYLVQKQFLTEHNRPSYRINTAIYMLNQLCKKE